MQTLVFISLEQTTYFDYGFWWIHLHSYMNKIIRAARYMQSHAMQLPVPFLLASEEWSGGGLNLEQSYPATSAGLQASSAVQGHPCRRTHGRTVKPAPGLYMCQLQGHHTWLHSGYTYIQVTTTQAFTHMYTESRAVWKIWTWCYEACVLQMMAGALKHKCINAQAQSWNSLFHLSRSQLRSNHLKG